MYLTPQHILIAGATDSPASTCSTVCSASRRSPACWRRPAAPWPRTLTWKNPVGELQTLLPQLSGQIDTAFCCLGSTIKQAGSQEAFRAVDHDLVLAFARRARELGARHLVVISALGANANSSVFYNRVKGETEEALKAMDWPQLTIAPPVAAARCAP
jgi:hypothetical protein